MTTYTAGDQINRALRLIGVLAEGETPSAEMSQDALMALNQMIDSWNTERLAVFSTSDQVVIWPAGEITQTLGPTGSLVLKNNQISFVDSYLSSEHDGLVTQEDQDLIIVQDAPPPITLKPFRPVEVDEATHFVDPGSGISYNLRLINRQQYNGIALKTVTSTLPQLLFVNMTNPDIELTLYPVPTRNLELHVVSVTELTQPANLSTPLVFPPGYLRAFTYNLALEIAPEFGQQPSPDVRRVAAKSLSNIKRINDPGDEMGIPIPLVPRSRFNIYSGE